MNDTPQHEQIELEKAYLAALELVRVRSEALEGPSLWIRWARLPRATRSRIRDSFTPTELAMLAYSWAAWARPKQRPPSELLDGFRIILWLMGRGSGKTKSAAERVRERVEDGARSIALIGPTLDDVEIYMLGRYEEDDGLLNIFPPSQKPKYSVDAGIVKFHTGATGYVYSAEKSELRGPNFDTVWCDEVAQWRFLVPLWNNIELATRKAGPVPVEIIISTTPRPIQFLKDLIMDPDCMTIHGETQENPHNDERWLARMLKKFSGSRLGDQELRALILGDDPDALFWATVFEATRVEYQPPSLRTVIAVDPAISTEPKNDETGIVAEGDDEQGHIYLLADLSGRWKPNEWGKLVVDAYDELNAVAIVGERNRGGDLVESNVRAAMERKRGGIAAAALTFENVTATRGKMIRAEPVSTLHKQGLIHVVGHGLGKLESEVTTWNPKIGGPSPNRLDAMVWGAYYLGNLSGEEKPDLRKGFEGVSRANQVIAQRQRASSQNPAHSMATRSEVATSSGRYPPVTGSRVVRRGI